jgi:histidinol-phosphatase
MDVARAASAAAAAAALAHWRRLEAVERKADGTPVTAADRAAESAAIAVIDAAFPEHDVLGEEGGGRDRGRAHRWVVDPLDGTRGFSRGGRMWGPLVALEEEGEVVAAAMDLPALSTAYAGAKGLGCWRGADRCRVSTTSRWEDAIVSLGGLDRVLWRSPQGPAIEPLLRTAWSLRAYGDLASCAMVLDGAADVWIEWGVKVWDLAAPRLLVEEAGGTFTDLAGRPTHASGSVVAGNARIHAHVMRALRA